jgi:hypothetical protein
MAAKPSRTKIKQANARRRRSVQRKRRPSTNVVDELCRTLVPVIGGVLAALGRETRQNPLDSTLFPRAPQRDERKADDFEAVNDWIN